MKFCNSCDNMYYITVEEDKLIYYCRYCNHKEVGTSEATRVIDNKLSNNVEIHKMYMNKDIIHDPTLPRVNNIDCKYKCPKGSEIIYVKYDNTNMKYIYFCTVCEKFWNLAGSLNDDKNI